MKQSLLRFACEVIGSVCSYIFIMYVFVYILAMYTMHTVYFNVVVVGWGATFNDVMSVSSSS